MRAWLAAVCCALAWAGAALAQPPQPDYPHAFAAARAALAPHDDGYFLDDDPVGPDLMRDLWHVGEQAADGYLADHSGASAAELKVALQALDKDLDVEVVPLAGPNMLVALRLGGQGHAFAARPSGVFWRASQPVYGDQGDLAPLRAWTPAAARGDCRQKLSDADWADCGGISPDIIELPNGPGRVRRFALIGVYAQQAGETESAQISFWRWDQAVSHPVEPLLVRTYQFKIELDEGLRIDGDIATLTVKGDFKSFISCGACAGRQLRWNFYLPPNGEVRDLGQTSLAGC